MADRWQQVEKLFQSALELEESRRRAFLEEACAGDEELRREVESLLKFDKPGDRFIKEPALEMAAKMIAHEKPESLIGQRIGSYQILALLGAGGMGVVYKARDTRLSRSVAVKVLQPDRMGDPERKRRFIQEARAASALNHPNIISIYDIGNERGIDFIVMEYVGGKTLDGRIPRKGMRLDEALRVAVQMADALAKAHSAGIIHRDLKPSNVIVAEDGLVKILDFGLAKLTEVSETGDTEARTLPTQTEEGTIVGTVSYMSPEQAEGRKIDVRSDIFSFGAVLYEMVTGRKAFEGASKMSTLAAILNQEPKPISQLVPGIARDLETIINRCLRKAAERRWQTMADLKVALQELKEESDSGKLARTPPVAGGPMSRHRWHSWAAVSGLTLIAASVLAYLLARPVPPPHVLRTVQLTNTNRPKSGLVTDGSRLYFVEGVSNPSIAGGTDLSQVSVTGGETVPVNTSFQNAGSLRLADISPDRSELLVITSRGTVSEGPLWTLPALGGSPRRLSNLEAHDVAWSPDGQKIVYSRKNAIFLARSDGTEPRQLLVTAGLSEGLRWSPDGRILRFTVYDPQTNNRSLWQASSDGGNLHPLLPGWNNSSNECCGHWTADGTYFVFQATHAGTANVWAIREGRGIFRPTRHEPVQLTTGPLNFGEPLPSKDGKKLFVQGWQPRAEVVRHDAKSGQFTPYLSGISALWLDFSRDGEWVAYSKYAEGTLWRSKMDGSQKLQLTFPPLQAYSPRWSPDDKQVTFFARHPGERWQIYVVPAAGGSPELIYRSESSLGDPNWFPDGKSLIFGELSNQSSGIYVLDLETRKTSKLPESDGLYAPRLSPDGRHLVSLTSDSLKLVLYDFSSQRWTDLVKMSMAYPKWSRHGDAIYFRGFFGSEPGYFRVRISDRKVEQVVSLKGFHSPGGIFGLWAGLAPDGSPLFVRDASIQEIYALDWEAP